MSERWGRGVGGGGGIDLGALSDAMQEKLPTDLARYS